MSGLAPDTRRLPPARARCIFLGAPFIAACAGARRSRALGTAAAGVLLHLAKRSRDPQADAGLRARPSLGRSHWFALSGTGRLRYETISGHARAGFKTSDDLLNLRTTVRPSTKQRRSSLWPSYGTAASVATPVRTGEVNMLELVDAFVKARRRPFTPAASSSTLARRLVAADDHQNATSGLFGRAGEPPCNCEAVRRVCAPSADLPSAPGSFRLLHRIQFAALKGPNAVA